MTLLVPMPFGGPVYGAPSTENRIGRVLVLVGTILGGLSVVVLLVAGVLALGGTAALAREAPDGFFVLGMIGLLYVVLAAVGVAGVVVALTALSAAAAGRVRQAAIRGIVASMLPPVGVLLLAGSILWLVSPEAKAEEAAARAGRAP